MVETGVDRWRGAQDGFDRGAELSGVGCLVSGEGEGLEDPLGRWMVQPLNGVALLKGDAPGVEEHCDVGPRRRAGVAQLGRDDHTGTGGLRSALDADLGVAVEAEHDLPHRVGVRADGGGAGLGEHRHVRCGQQARAVGISKTSRSGRRQPHAVDTIAAIPLGGLLIVAGLTHWVFPAYYRALVPTWIIWPGPVVALSGVLDVLVGVAVLVPGTRAGGAIGAAALVTVYLVSHVDALAHTDRTRRRLLDRPAGAVLRVVVNLAYIAWAVLLAVSAW
jgi:uncharacterized membrane protein